MEKWRDGAAFELKEREAEWILKFQICVNRERLLLLPRRRHRRPRPRPSPAVEVSTASATYLAVAIFGAKEGKRPSVSKRQLPPQSGAWVARILWQREKVEKWKKTHIQITSRKASLAWQLALPPHLSWLDPLTGWVARVVGIFFYTATHSQIESVGFMRGRRTRDVDSG